jgi:hypothetical protein
MKRSPNGPLRSSTSDRTADGVDGRPRGGMRTRGKRTTVDQIADSVPPPDEPEIGYRKPPSQYQWRKGRSGNPAGRKKGSRNKRTIIVHLMEQKLGRKIENLSALTRYEAMLLKGIQKALTGDTKAMAFILRRYDDAAESQVVTEHAASERDEVVYAALVEKIRRELQGGN